MAIVKLSGIDVDLTLNTKIFGCAKNIDLDITTAMDEATCRASGGWNEAVPGKHSWKADTSALLRIITGADAAANVSIDQLVAMQIARTAIGVSFGTTKLGGTVYTGTAYISNIKQSSPETGAATASLSLVGTGPLVAAVNV